MIGLAGEGRGAQTKVGLEQEVGRRHRRDQLNTTRQANHLRKGALRFCLTSLK